VIFQINKAETSLSLASYKRAIPLPLGSEKSWTIGKERKRSVAECLKSEALKLSENYFTMAVIHCKYSLI